MNHRFRVRGIASPANVHRVGKLKGRLSSFGFSKLLHRPDSRNSRRPRNCRLREIGCNLRQEAATRFEWERSRTNSKLTEQTEAASDTGISGMWMFFDRSRRSHFLKDRCNDGLKACRWILFTSFYGCLRAARDALSLRLTARNLTVNGNEFFFATRPQLDLFAENRS